MKNPITKSAIVKVYLCQHPNGSTFLVSQHHAGKNLRLPDHWKVLAETSFDVTLTGDAGHDAGRAHPDGS